jgi:hypothetical protein
MSTLSTPAVNLRSEIAETQGLRRSIKPGLRRVAFANLVTNGDFATDTDWTKGTGWTISGGVANAAAGTGSGMTQDVDSLKSGRSYWIQASYAVSAGTVQPVLAGNNSGDVGGATVSTTEVNAQVLTATSNTFGVRMFKGGAGAGTVDDIAVWEADPSDDAPWLRLPAGYQLGDAGRVVRDGLELMDGDFTEILTGIGDNLQAFIKPTTAPGVSTKFNVWCAPQ